MKAASILRLTLMASLLLIWYGTISGALAFPFGQPVSQEKPEGQTSPEIEAASKRVDESKAKLEQARRQLDAAKASLKAADAEYRAARADREALSLRRQANKLADASSRPSQDTNQATQAATSTFGRLNPPSASQNVNGTANASAPLPDAAGEQGEYQKMEEQSNVPGQ